MNTLPLLATKLTPPRVRTARPLARPRLTARLDEGLRRGRKLSLIAAPAGYGKTTLVATWLATEPAPAAWLTLDESDNDPARFLAYFAAALRRVQPGIEAKWPAAGQASTRSTLMALINALAARTEPCALVLDDYHLITAPEIHAAMTFWLEHQPAQVHLVIGTRADPPLPLPLLRGRGQLTELRAADLRFTPEEAADFMRRTLGLDLSDEHIAALQARSEGWAAGLQMAALSLQRQDDVARFVADFAGSNRYIMDYLIEEVLSRQPPGVQRFLLQSAILEQLSAPLCDAVVDEHGMESAQAVLEHLEHANLFIVPLDAQRVWYRYHRLFADLLRRNLARDDAESVPALHHRASAWLAEHGRSGAAIQHALQAQDFDRAAQLIEAEAEGTLMRSEWVTFMGWIEALPEARVRERPILCAYHAWTLMLNGHPISEVEARLRHADDAETGSDSALTAPIRAYIAMFRGDIPGALVLARQAMGQLTEDHAFLHNITQWCLGVAQMINGDFAGGERTLNEALRVSRSIGNLLVTVMALSNLAELQGAQGRPAEAWSTYQRALALAAQDVPAQGTTRPIASVPLQGLGELALQRNELDAAAEYFRRSIELANAWGAMGTLDCYVGLAYVRQAQGDDEAAQAMLQKAQHIAARFDATELDDRVVEMRQAHLWINQGRLDEAARWAQARGLNAEAGVEALARPENRMETHIRRREFVEVARMLLAQGHAEAALRLLRHLLASMQERGRGSVRRIIQLHVLEALAHQATGASDAAHAALARALALGRPPWYVRVYVENGAPLARLLRAPAARRIDPEATRALLAALGETAPPPTPAALIEPLSERELEILHLIAKGLTNREIGQRLYIALPTVKWHTSNLYGKLNVGNRTEAVARARELGLLD